MSSRYQHSLTLSARAEQSIPLGSQTFSKSRLCFPYGAAPLFIERGQGARVWDVDGNEYLMATSTWILPAACSPSAWAIAIRM